MITRVENFANLRSAPDFKASVVVEAPKSTLVTVVENGGRLWGTQDTVNRCQQACNAFGNYWDYDDKSQFYAHKAAVRQCFEDNAIWYKVRTEQGREGFVSAKFLNSPFDGYNP